MMAIARMEKEPLVDIHEAARFLSIKPNTLRIWCAERRIPFLKAGHRLRFRLTDLETWAGKIEK
jgi:excisionase family DNA binding protein